MISIVTDIKEGGASFDPISQDELLLQSFAMDYPDAEPTPNQFSVRMQQRAGDVLQYSNFIDKTLDIQVSDEEQLGPTASRDVLVTYKTLLYKAVWQAEQWRDQADRYKYISWLLGLGLVGVMVWSYTHFPVASFQHPQ